MSEFTFVPATAADRGEIASYLLALAAEKNLPADVVRKTFGGYNVPAGLVEDGEFTPVAPVAGKGDVTEDAPAWYFDAGRPVDVEYGDDGTIVVKAEVAEAIAEEFGTTVEALNESFSPEDVPVLDDREVVREWAKANGYNPAEKGALKKAVIEAYQQAHS